MATLTRSKRFLDELPKWEAIRAEKARRHFRHFIPLMWPIIEPATPLRMTWYLTALADHLEAVSRRQIRNLLVTIPPGTGKSTVCSVLWPAWHWINFASDRFLSASYAMNLAIRDSVRCRRIIESPEYQDLWGDRFQLTSDQNVKGRFENNKTGFRVTTSVGGGTTGERCNFTLIDDPHNVAEAESTAVREQTLRWHDEAFFNRINNAKAGGRVIVGQRVHHDDLIGNVLRAGGFEELRLPEEFEADHRSATCIGWQDPREEDRELLRPGVFDQQQIEEAKVRLASFGYSAQHQQRPVPREGALFKLAWFDKRYEIVGDWYEIPGQHPLLRKDCWHFGMCDPAGGESTSADYTAIGIFAVTPKCDMILRLMIRERIPLEEIPRRLVEVSEEWKLKFLGIESDFLQHKIAKQARLLRGMCPVKEIVTGGKDKLARAIPAVVRAEARQILLPLSASWLDDFISELAIFTGKNDKRDDQVDVLANAAAYVQSHGKGKSGNRMPLAKGGLP